MKTTLDFENGCVELSHGSGGRAMADLIEGLFMPLFANEMLSKRNDQAEFSVSAGRMVLTTDAHVVSPLFFPGGDIGSLSVNGTINDVAMSGAKPLYLSAAMILEEGFPLKKLKAITESMARASREAQVPIITGDTKVVERGGADGMFITTTGVGVVPADVLISGDRARPGDKVIINGPIGDHGIAIMALRNGLGFETTIESDCAALHGLVAVMLEASRAVRVLRDPTRGGLGTTLNEIAEQSKAGILLNEDAIPIRTEVRAACEILGIDPLYVANEGKLIAIVPAEEVDRLLEAMRRHPLGVHSVVIGEVIEERNHFVQMRTSFGGTRIVQWLTGEQLPRIC